MLDLGTVEARKVKLLGETNFPSRKVALKDWTASLPNITETLKHCLNLPADFVGVAKPAILQNLGINAENLGAMIQRKSGYDAFVFNPHPHHDVLFENHWVRAEALIPGFIDQTKLLRKAAGWQYSPFKTMQPQLICTGEAIVGNKVFFSELLEFIEHLRTTYQQQNGDLDQLLRLTLFQTKRLSTNGSLETLNVLFSILITEFLGQASTRLKTLKLQRELRIQSNQQDLLLLAEMRQSIKVSQESSGYRFWRGYRDLYLEKLMTKSEHEIFKKSITKPDHDTRANSLRLRTPKTS